MAATSNCAFRQQMHSPRIGAPIFRPLTLVLCHRSWTNDRRLRKHTICRRLCSSASLMNRSTRSHTHRSTRLPVAFPSPSQHLPSPHGSFSLPCRVPSPRPYTCPHLPVGCPTLPLPSRASASPSQPFPLSSLPYPSPSLCLPAPSRCLPAPSRRFKPREGDGRAWGGGYGLGTPTGRQRELSSTRGRCCHGPPPRDAAQHMGKKRSRGGPRRAPRWRQTKWCTAGKQSAARHEERDGVPFPETAAGQRADAMREAGVSRCGDRSSGGERRAGGRQSAVGEERRLPTAFPAFPSPSPSIPGRRDGAGAPDGRPRS